MIRAQYEDKPLVVEILSNSFEDNKSVNYVINQEDGAAELYIDRGNEQENKGIFDKLYAQRESVEKAFGEKLSWERLDAKRACRIKFIVLGGGYRTAESHWPAVQSEMVSSMTKLEEALQPALDSLEI